MAETGNRHGLEKIRRWRRQFSSAALSAEKVLDEFVAERQRGMSNNNTQGKTGIGKVLLTVIGIIAAVIFIRHLGEIDDAKHIEAALAQDKAISETLNTRVQGQKSDSMEDFDRLAGYIDEFVEQERRIDISQCPRDFAEAYARYISAYSEEAGVLHGHPRIPSAAEAFGGGVAHGMQGDPMGEVREINDSIDAWQKRWHEKADLATQADRQMRAVATRYERYAWPRFD
jgi:type II secretory pathway pseudopilin PulG